MINDVRAQSGNGTSSSSTDGDVVVAHLNAQHSHFLAIALQEAGLLASYLTGLYTAWNQKPFKYLQRAPSPVKQQIEQKVFKPFRRQMDGLSAENVTALVPIQEAGLAMAKRAGLPATWWNRASQMLSIGFQQRVAQYAIDNGSSAVVSFDKLAFETFAKLEQTDIIRVLDQSTAHPEVHETLLAEERQRHPDFADTITLPSEKSRWVDRWSEEPLKANYVLAGSSFVKRSLVERGTPADNVFVVPYGVDTSRFRAKSENEVDESTFTVLFAGSMMQRKGISYLMEAMSKLDLPNLRLLMCGGKVGSGKWLKQYEHLPIDYLGRVSYYDMPEMFRRADLFVLPTLVEGLAQVNLEAMASGLPVVTTAHSGADDFVVDGEHGYIIPIRDADAIAERIRHCYTNRDHCRQMGLAAREVALRHDWRDYNAQVKQVFQDMLGRAA